jgi:hypothetical protein
MEYDLFRNNVQQVKAKKPILFEAGSSMTAFGCKGAESL